jgi:hypothetical protein
MAEIKSALELALERSKKYVISDEEREKMRQKEILQKAMGLFHRFKEGHLSINEMMKEIERMDDKMRERVKEILLSQWTEHLALDPDSERLFDALESLKGRSLQSLREKFESLRSVYHHEIKEARQTLSLDLAEALKSEGIDGDAVEPNPEGSEKWESRVERIDRSHQGRLNEIKDALKSL